MYIRVLHWVRTPVISIRSTDLRISPGPKTKHFTYSKPLELSMTKVNDAILRVVTEK